MSVLEKVVGLTPAVRAELMVLVARKVQQAAVCSDLSVKENAYAAAVSLVDSVAQYLGGCNLRESPSESVEQLLVSAGS